MEIMCNNFVNGIVEQVGNQPVRIFYFRLIDTFHVIRRELEIEYPDKQLSNVQFKYRVDDSSPQSPKCSKHFIEFHETFMSFLWTYSYGLFMSFPHGKEQLEQKLGRNATQEELKQFYNEQLDKGHKLLDYSMMLPKMYIAWDKSLLPNPEIHGKEDSKNINRVNSLFYYGYVFILYHEFAHIILDHDPLVIDQDERKKMEDEADKFAVTRMLKTSNGSTETVTRAMIYALCSLTFCSAYFSGGKFHPDIDTRILKALELINYDENHVSWATASWAILQWYSKADVQFTFPTPFKNFKDTFYGYLDKIKEIKRP